MSKIIRIIVFMIIFSAAVTGLTDFITRQAAVNVSFNKPISACGAIQSSADSYDVTLRPIATSRGYPYWYRQNAPSAVAGICVPSVIYSDTFNAGHLAIDLVEWGLMGFLIIYTWEHFRSRHA